MIPSVPRRSNVKPRVAPTMEWVVDTGNRSDVASNSHTPPPKSFFWIFIDFSDFLIFTLIFSFILII
jgi:hypothetical protein